MIGCPTNATMGWLPTRQGLRWLAVAGFLGICLLPILLGTGAHAALNPVQAENQQTGTTNWQLGSLVADDVGSQIKGYASATSVAAGDVLTFYVTVRPAQSFALDLYRIGWYAGAGGRLISHVGGITGITQQSCPVDAVMGTIACSWQPSYSVTTPAAWTSGTYLAVLTNAAGYQNYIPLVVRDGRQAALLYQQSVTTYQAYNNYPDNNQTGKSLYEYNSYGAKTVTGTTRAAKVSFDRPYSSDGSGQFFDNELTFIQWAEKQGYDITYSTDIDTHANGARLLQNRAFLSVGHDEYWSKQMFDAVALARDSKVNLGFFGANDVFWQMRMEASSGGVANRVMVCYKDATLDPVQGPTTTVNFRDPQVNRPEQTLVGIQFIDLGTYGVDAPYVVDAPTNWVFNGTGASKGTAIPGIVGYEIDSYQSQYPPPAYTSYTILSNSPFTTRSNTTAYSNSSIYQAPSGAWAFAAGTIDWSHGLDPVKGDDRVRRTTSNILDQFSGPNSPTSAPLISSTSSRASYTLNVQQATAASNWYEVDSSLRMTITIASGEAALVGANMDLWTGATGFNQDLGVFKTDCSLGNLLTWKESGGFAGTLSPNAAFVQTVITTPGTYTLTLCWKANKVAPAGTIFGAAGTAGTYFSPTTLTAKVLPASRVATAVALRSYHLDMQQPDGASTWYQIDPALSINITAPATGNLLLGGNMDLWTAAVGYNQDLAIFAGRDCGNLNNLISWKESGGFAGTFSPNAAFVEGWVPVSAGQSYAYTLCWKANQAAPPGTLYGAAGTGDTYFSPTRITAEFVDAGRGSSSVGTNSYTLSAQQPDASSTWYEVDPALRVTVSGTSGQKVVLGANMDLWTVATGYNQDLAIFYGTDCSILGRLIAWKESGGLAGTFSPNAAYVQATYPLTSSGASTFTLCWKANKVAPAGDIDGAAGTAQTYFSPTRLTAEIGG